MLGLPRGVEGYYIVLATLLGEAIYIFGTNFYWLQEHLVGVLAAFFGRFLGKQPEMSCSRSISC